jgi:Spondin_N
MKKIILAGLLASSFSSMTYAANYSIKIENLTYGSYFTPFLVAAHPSAVKLFDVGDEASANLQKMAEGGEIDNLKEDVMTAQGNVATPDAEEGLLAPSGWKSYTLNAPDAANTQLSVVGMVLPSNDGFAGLNSITLPTSVGTWSYLVNAYDAGTEANDEKRGSGASGEVGFPVPPPLENLLGTNGSGVTGVEKENFVHIHRGVLGDQNTTGGASDINASVQRWLNPVIRVTVTVTN